MRRLLWGGTYVLVFIVSFVGGMAVNTLSGQSFAGIEQVDWDDSMGTIETDLRYGDEPLNTFDLYLPSDKTSATKLVLYIHAGGFTGGDKADDTNMGMHFASKGYVGATINYSLRSDANAVSVVEMSHEIRRGVDAIVGAARERGYDLDGMVIAGGSAGGTLAMIYAYRDALDAPVPVTTVINLVGPASFEPSAWFDFDDDYASEETAEAGAGFVEVITGEAVTPEMMRTGEYRAVLEPVTAADLFSEHAPPTLLAYGELDKVAPFAASTGLIDEVEASSVPHDVFAFPNSGHALNRDPEMNDELGRTIDEYLDRYAPLG